MSTEPENDSREIRVMLKDMIEKRARVQIQIVLLYETIEILKTKIGNNYVSNYNEISKEIEKNYEELKKLKILNEEMFDVEKTLRRKNRELTKMPINHSSCLDRLSLIAGPSRSQLRKGRVIK